MAAVLAPFQSPVGSNLDRQNQMIEYAFSRYQYVITPRECEEILTQSYWESVDAFCCYMMAANFGQSIHGTRNVKLPTTLRLYTDAELDAMEQGSHIVRPAAEAPTSTVDLEVTRLEDAPRADITEADLEVEEREETELDDECLPPYTPDTRPPYSLVDPMKAISEISLETQADIPEDDPPAYTPAVADTPEDSAITEIDPDSAVPDTCCNISSVRDALRNDSIKEAETEVCRTPRLALRSLGARAEQKLRRFTRAALPKKTVFRAREIKKKIRQK
ncbi:hypothetical protein GGR53DRAFT_474043 [Hypoxylon sp. FL1150]|nr:hypothetical protein GGR53DRAFT_474043 [Hypoxylon sp. FL1150]